MNDAFQRFDDAFDEDIDVMIDRRSQRRPEHAVQCAVHRRARQSRMFRRRQSQSSSGRTSGPDHRTPLPSALAGIGLCSRRPQTRRNAMRFDDA